MLHQGFSKSRKLRGFASSRQLGDEHPGLYRFAQMLENMAQGIQSGAISVPKDH